MHSRFRTLWAMTCFSAGTPAVAQEPLPDAVQQALAAFEPTNTGGGPANRYLAPPCGDASSEISVAEVDGRVVITSTSERPLAVTYREGFVSVNGAVSWKVGLHLGMKKGEFQRMQAAPQMRTEAGRTYGTFRTYHTAVYMDAVYPNGEYDPTRPTECGRLWIALGKAVEARWRAANPPAAPVPARGAM